MVSYIYLFFFQVKSTSKDLQVIPDSITYAKDMVLEAPPLLFAAYTHMDILGLGACPWAYIRAVSDCLLQVRAIIIFLFSHLCFPLEMDI